MSKDGKTNTILSNHFRLQSTARALFSDSWAQNEGLPCAQLFLKEFLVWDLCFLVPFELVGRGERCTLLELVTLGFFYMLILSSHSKKTKLKRVSKYLK